MAPYNTYPSQWSYPHVSQANHRITPFAQSIYQQILPAASYPTPPPPGIVASSSSLANALGDYPVRSSKPYYHQNDSARFFNTFVSETTTALASQPAIRNDSSRIQRQQEHKEESPDPLTISPPHLRATHEHPDTRKLTQPMAPALMGRIQPGTALHNTRPVEPPQKPCTPVSLKTPSTPTPRLKPYVQVPPLPHMYMTPVSRKRKHSEMKTSMKRTSSSDDLGGFGSEGDQEAPLVSVAGSSSRRATGERDERGLSQPLEVAYITDCL